MTVTEIPAGIAADLDAVQGLLDQARRTAVSDGTHVSAIVNVHCPSIEAVDCAAAQWGTVAEWSEDRRQYLARAGNWRITLYAVHMPDPAGSVSARSAA